jgi:hypothetical protein
MRTRTTFPGAGLLAAIALVGLLTAPGRGQGTSADQPTGTDIPAFTQEELAQILAPIALYPDPLLSQVLMASTYPLEIVQADRWVKSHRDLKDEKTAKALEAESWDPSVKSLVNFPDVLSMLSEQLEWTQQLGDAFIGQQQEVMDTIQTLRAKAKAAGNLESTKEQKVDVVQEGSSDVIVIQQADPDVIYVPAANPTVVYGSWPYPAYPPYSYYPPGYAWGAAAVSFGAGVACGAAWGYAWGHCNWGWGHGDIDIDTNRNINRNTNIDRSRYQRDLANRGGLGDRGAVGDRGGRGGRNSWQHNPAHRQGVPYRNQREASRFGGTSAGQAARSREAFRGRADAGRRDLAAGGASQFRDQGLGRQPDRGAANRGIGDRSAGNRSGAGGSAANRARSSSAGRDSAFSGANRGGSAARASSNRGHSSMSGSRGGGGGRSSGISRGGGGMRGGGMRGGGRR